MCSSELKRVSQSKQIKRDMDAAVKLFNEKPKKGIQYLVDKDMIQNTPEAAALFLMTCDRLNKKEIGAYLGERLVPLLASVFF